jgi:signal transduction histidine kinase
VTWTVGSRSRVAPPGVALLPRHPSPVLEHPDTKLAALFAGDGDGGGPARPPATGDRPRRDARRALSWLARVALLATVYYLSGRLGLELSYRGISSPVWPPAGVAVAGLWLFGLRTWPGVTIGGALVGLHNGAVGLSDAGTMMAQTLGPIAAVALLRGHGFNPSLERLRDVLQLVVFGSAGTLLTATLATVVMAVTGVVAASEWMGVWAIWWAGDVMGVVLVAPVLLSVTSRSSTRFRRVEGSVLLVAAAIGTRLLFSGGLPLVFLVFPLVLWSALRLGPRGAAAVDAVVVGVALWTGVGRHGPFSELPDTFGLVTLEVFIGTVGITSLALSATVATAARLAFENARLHSEVRAQLEEVWASRARIVEAGDAERRRMERDLHDGAQQRLVSLACTLGLARARLPATVSAELHASLAAALAEVRLALAELRDLAHGIHPAILADEGLGAALETLAEQALVPVDVVVPAVRCPPALEATAYFVVSEALVNISKHARATAARVTVDQREGRLVVEVSDDGVGGADPTAGSGLTGLSDRVAALGGNVRIVSPPGSGTSVRVELPCDSS